MSALNEVLPLSEWANFYVIIGTSAGALTGLTFIVITISGGPGDRAGSAAMRLTGLRAFITPTAVHFSAALWISALLSMPRHTALSGALCMGVTSIAGIVYSSYVLHWMTRISAEYRPFIADWVWNVGLPALAYVSLLAAAVLMIRDPAPSLYVVGGTLLLLLAIGIHNAWDVVVWFTTERHAHPDRVRAARRTGSESPERRGGG